MSVGGAPLHAAVPLLLLLLLCGGAMCTDVYGAFAPQAAAAFATAGQSGLASALLALAATPRATTTAGEVVDIFSGLHRTLQGLNPLGMVRGGGVCVCGGGGGADLCRCLVVGAGQRCSWVLPHAGLGAAQPDACHLRALALPITLVTLMYQSLSPCLPWCRYRGTGCTSARVASPRSPSWLSTPA